MKRLLVGAVLALVALDGAPPRESEAAAPAILSAAAHPWIRSRVSISKAFSPSRDSRLVADDLHEVNRQASPGVTEFDERVTSYAEDPGGPTILIPEDATGFDPQLPDNGVIGRFSGTSTVKAHTSVVTTADTARVRSSADLSCRKTRIPSNALMGASSTGFAVDTVQIQITQPCAYRFTATVSVDVDDDFNGEGHASVVLLGADPQLDADKVGRASVEVQRRKPPASGSSSTSVTGVFQPGTVSIGMNAELVFAGPEGRASWSASLELSPVVQSDEIRWKVPKDGSPAAVANWEPPVVPTDDGMTRNETAVFDRGGNYTVDFAATTKALGPPRTWERHRQRTATVRFTHADLTLTSTSLADPSLVVDGGAELTLEDCHLTTQHARVGDQRAGYGLIDLDGPSTVWDCLGTLVVGGAGGAQEADVGVNDGARLTSGPAGVGEGGQEAYVQIVHGGASWTSGDVDVGITGAGTVDVFGDAHWTSGDVSIGNSPSGRGLVKLRSPNFPQPAADWVGGDVVVGGGGPGELRVSNGCSASVEDVTVGADSGGACVVEGVVSLGVRPSSFLCRSLALGPLGDLRVTGGATMTVSDEMQVDGSFAHVSGSDAATMLRSTLTVGATLILGGDRNAGFLTIEPGAQMTCGSAILGPGPGAFSSGNLDVGGRFGPPPTSAADCNILGDLIVGQSPGRGSVSLRAPSTLTVGGKLSVGQGSTIDGSGTVRVGGALELDGTVSPGISILAQPAKSAPRAKPAPPAGGTLTIDGDLVVGPTGTIVADAAGPEASRIVVTGDATLGGTLVLQFRNGFAPRAGDAFEIVQANGTVNGGFASVDVQGLAPGAQFDVTTTAGALKATATTDTVALPTVGVKASPTRLLEKKPKKKGTLTFARKGDVSAPLTVAYTVGGTAGNGADCVQLVGTVTFPARKKTVKVAVTVASDPFVEGTETLEVSVVSGADYTASTASTARFAIIDFPPR